MTTKAANVVTGQALQELGFSEYEARAYMALVEGGELNGYALAKAANIPRPNVYAVLAKLVTRGAAQRAERSTGVAYVATAPKRLLRSIEANQKQAMRTARAVLAKLSPQASPAVVLNLRDDEVLGGARQLLDASEKSLLLAIQPGEASALAPSLRQARERGVAITTLCLEGCRAECGGCTGTIHRYRLTPPDDVRRLLVVCDDHKVLLAHVADKGAAAVLTEQPLMVELASAYIRQSVTLAVLGGEMAGRFEGLLSAETLHLLDDLYPTGDFIAHMRKLGDATPTTA